MDRFVESVTSSSSGESRWKISEITNTCDVTKIEITNDLELLQRGNISEIENTCDVTEIEIKDDLELLQQDPQWQKEMFKQSHWGSE